jgi:hypothetical protein
VINTAAVRRPHSARPPHRGRVRTKKLNRVRNLSTESDQVHSSEFMQIAGDGTGEILQVFESPVKPPR